MVVTGDYEVVRMRFREGVEENLCPVIAVAQVVHHAPFDVRSRSN